MKGFLIFIHLFVVTIQLPAKSNGIIYSWIDEQGKRHFGDQPSLHNHSYVFKGDELVSIKTVRSSPKHSQKIFKQHTRSGKRQSISNNKSRCAELGKKIAYFERKLTTKLTPDKFDMYKHELNQVRWKKIKSC